jgi:outer membrane lipoprotein
MARFMATQESLFVTSNKELCCRMWLRKSIQFDAMKWRNRAMPWAVRLPGICLVLVLLGCASGVSKQARSLVTYHGSFAALQKAIDEYKGETVMIGGKALRTDASQSSSEIAVLQLPLDRSNRPKDSDSSEGRFLIRSDQFLDPAIYQQGRLLTVVGRLAGKKVRSIGGFEYAYPVVEAIEIKPWPWPREKTWPSVHFGIGIGTWF